MGTRVLVMLASLPLMLGCEADPDSDKIQVVCTTGMVADIVEHVGGDYVAVQALMGAGVDPHLYKPVPGDVSALQGADLVFYSGLHLEGKMTEVLEQLAQQKPVVAVTDAVEESAILDADGAHDPHVWFDVELWAQTINLVRDRLKEYDPAHAAEYDANAKVHFDKLMDLHSFAKDQLATIPKEQRVLVTAHDAFRYFGNAYDIEVRGIQGISTESQASVGEVNDLVNFLVERKIKAVFVESSVSERNVEALVEGCRDQGHEITIGGELFSDAMGEAGTSEGTYVGMVRHNVETIVEALK